MLNYLAKRKCAPGGGRKPTLRTIEEKQFYILLYCKCYPTFDLLLSVLFNFDRSCAHDWVHR
ncbi:transposase family protein, partial [Cylindrospermopsis raciborskii]|uniref:helix-turn-helix domain-containing protein n=1 Tax=Cylindrospermopsis raciborskii TaxID=77022 RepID=UPI0026F1908B